MLISHENSRKKWKKPAVKQEAVTECTLIVMGLPFNSPNRVVHEMVENHGGHMVSPHCSMETIKDGPWRGQFHGTKR